MILFCLPVILNYYSLKICKSQQCTMKQVVLLFTHEKYHALLSPKENK